jgi:hypothetical protein
MLVESHSSSYANGLLDGPGERRPVLHDDTDSGTTAPAEFAEHPTEIDTPLARRLSYYGKSHACIEPTSIVILGMKHDSEIRQVLDDHLQQLGPAQRVGGIEANAHARARNAADDARPGRPGPIKSVPGPCELDAFAVTRSGCFHRFLSPGTFCSVNPCRRFHLRANIHRSTGSDRLEQLLRAHNRQRFGGSRRLSSLGEQPWAFSQMRSLTRGEGRHRTPTGAASRRACQDGQ